MKAYVDSSVLLRLALRDPAPLAEWGELTEGCTSALTAVECWRTLDRLSLQRSITEAEETAYRAQLQQLLASLDTLDVTRGILLRASQPLPVTLKTLDAIHLATALTWLEDRHDPWLLATHDVALARAGARMGLGIIGV